MYQGKQIEKDTDFPESLGVIIETPGFLTQYTGMKNLEILANMQRLISTDIRLTPKVGLDPDMKKTGWKVFAWNAPASWNRSGHYGRRIPVFSFWMNPSTDWINMA